MANKRLTISIPYDEFMDIERAFERLESEADRYTSYASEIFRIGLQTLLLSDKKTLQAAVEKCPSLPKGKAARKPKEAYSKEEFEVMFFCK